MPKVDTWHAGVGQQEDDAHLLLLSIHSHTKVIYAWLSTAHHMVPETSSPPLDNIQVMVDCLEVKREYYQNCSLLYCVTQCSQSAPHLWAVLTGPSDWVSQLGTLSLCIEAVAWSCIIVTWWSGSGRIQTWSRRSTGFVQCFDTVGLVIWPLNIIPKMTCNLSSGT